MATDLYRDPIFNLKAVVEATGVSDDALRAWERRYGLPEPDRTEAGHRIYSQRDIDIVRWLVARQQEGLRIGRAVELYRSLEESGQDPLRAMPSPADALRLPTGDQLSDLREEWLRGCLAFDEQRAEDALTHAFALYPPEVVCLEIIREAIAEIGRRWYRGEATVHQEHFAAQLAMRRIRTLMSSTPPPSRRGRIMVACPPNEQHAIGPFILSLLLRRAGWDVIYLGPNVPVRHMEETVDETGPDLVILGAQQLKTAASLHEVARRLGQKDVPVGFGGGIFNRLPQLQERVPGQFMGATIEQAVEVVEPMLFGRDQRPRLRARPDVYTAAASHFRDHQLALLACAWEHVRDTGLVLEPLREITRSFSDALLAALRLGDLDLLTEYVEWLGELRSEAYGSADIVPAVLSAYRDATKAQLNERGEPIVQWLDEQLAQHARGGAGLG